MAPAKIPILLKSGFWAMEDPAGTDYSMLTGLLCPLMICGDKWSIEVLFLNPKP